MVLVEYSERFYISSRTWLVPDWALLRMWLKNCINKLKKERKKERNGFSIQRKENKYHVQNLVHLLMWEINLIILLSMPMFPSLLRVFLVQFNSVAPTLCNPMDHSTPGLPAHHQLPEFTQTHVHWAGDTIQSSHTLSSPSPPMFNLSQHQGLFKWVSSLHQVAIVLEFQLQHETFQWTFRTDLL